MEKSLKDLSWDVDEKTYRNDPALSYSILSKYEKEGFQHLNTLFDKTESSGFLLGQLVDTLITDNEHFDDKFVIVDIPKVSDKIAEITDEILDIENDTEAIDVRQDYFNNDNNLINILNVYEYQQNWKTETRLSKFRELAFDYYNAKKSVGDKAIISNEDYQQAVECAEKIRYRFPMLIDTPFEDTEVLFQLKFKVNLNGIDYKFMPDITYVNHTDKKIFLIDIKTTGYPEYEFYKAYIKWNYSLQSRLYTRGLKEIISNSNEFRNYTIMPFRFIVINRETQIPLEWKCNHCYAVGDLIMGKNKDIILKDPEDIGKELHDYLINKPKVPNDVKENEANDLNWFINNKM